MAEEKRAASCRRSGDSGRAQIRHPAAPAGKRRIRLETWFDEGTRRLLCLPWEAETGLRWAELLAALRKAGRAMPVKDSLIAATALAHGLTVVTRNRADFENAGVELLDPFAL